MMQPRIVYQDEALLVLDKPAGLPTTSPDGQRCLSALARAIDPSAPRMHASSRLDAEVTGLVTFARTVRAIAELLRARREGRYLRTYLGLCTRRLEVPEGEWRFRIARDPRDPRRRVALPEASTRGQQACSRYRVLAVTPHAQLMALHPQTGRTHQLRVHAAAAGAPLLGDRHYGGPMRVTLDDGRVVRAPRVMLHCARVELPSLSLCLQAQAPADMQDVWSALGGEAAALRPP